MTTDNTQSELDEQIGKILDFHAANAGYKSWSSKEEATQAINTLINKQIEEVLDTVLAKAKEPWKYDVVGFIEAERNKLKERDDENDMRQ